jgi:hypothetical protein
MPLNGTGQAGVMGQSLSIAVPNRKWGITIRRKDNATDSTFHQFHDKPITQDDIKQIFLPTWKSLVWDIIDPQSPGQPTECRAVDLEYVVVLSFPSNTPLTGSKVTTEFTTDLK